SHLERVASLYPSKDAVVYKKERLTFSDINRKSELLAACFQSIGIQRGDRVVVCLGNRTETVIAFWAVLKAGAVVIPVGKELKPEKLEYILNDSEASALITTENKFAELSREAIPVSLLRTFLTDTERMAEEDSFFIPFKDALRENYTPLKETGVISVDLAAIIYTSGSTGQPKGVMLTHQNMMAATYSLNTYLGYTEHDKVLCSLPLSFDYGLYQMIMCISTGATLLLEEEFTWAIFLLKKIAAEKVTILPAVPTMVMMLHEQNKKRKTDLSSVRKVTNTGAALTEKNIGMVKELFPNTQLFSMYGLTECKRCTYLPPEDIDKKPKSVGIAIPDTELWLVDDDGNKITTPNTIGQLVIRGATVMRGYWKKPEKTAEKLKEGVFPGEKVLYTGDYCMLDGDGYLYFKGRMDQVIKSRGIKVSPREVEDYISKLPDVNAVAIVGVPHEDYGEALCAFVVPEDGTTLVTQSIIENCRNDLEAYKVPEHVVFIESIPKTPNGKFNKLALEQEALQHIGQLNEA
ncbi:MAG: class I adenylate-forming enzyme family protein, partial [Bacteroidota bacterium]